MTGWNRRKFLSFGPLSGLSHSQGRGSGFRFALIGDRTGTAAPQIYSRVWREVNLFGPDIAISIGDTIQGLNDATAVAEWREMDAVWQRYKRFPAYFVPGNHDIWSPESKRLFEKEAGHPASHSFIHGAALFVILDNSRTEDLAPEQLTYCESELAKHKSLRPKFVFCHRPSWILNARVGNRGFALHGLARKYEVDYVISGHGHQLVHLELDGVRYLEIGSSGGSIERGLRLGQGFKDGWFYHWIWTQVRDGKVEMTVKEVTGQGRLFRLSDWGPAGPRFDPADPALLDSPRL
ncbi:MAG: metallophosphoesterase family protein [Bryobacteraceae bacterium]